MNRLDDFNWNRQPKRSKRWDVGFGIWAMFCLVIGLGLTAFGVWAVYTLVVWVTSK
jgi:hypothetical protein